jgi:hypothetical protein
MTALLFGFALTVLPAQSNELVDRLIEQEKTTYGVASYMIMSSIDELPEDATVQDALESVTAQDWAVSVPSEASEPIRLGEYSYLIMRALEIEGGIMYRLFPGGRYAARELKHLEVIPTESAARRTLTGSEALLILRRAIEWKEGRS